MHCVQVVSQIDQTGVVDASARKGAINLITKECKAALTAIPGTLEADQEALNNIKAQLAGKDILSVTSLQRRADILKVRINERKILNKNLFTLRRQTLTT